MRAIVSLVFLSAFCWAESEAVLPGPSLGEGDPAKLGWSTAKLGKARAYLANLPPASVLLIDRGRVVAEWGDPAKRSKVASVRKSFLSSLYGIYADKGRIDLDKTLAELGIDDRPALTDMEKKASIRMLLESRSGIYHGYVSGTPGMRAVTPARGSHMPGSFWYYNNWDFNALGTIFEKVTGTGLAEALRDSIARPIGMEDYRVEDLSHYSSPAMRLNSPSLRTGHIRSGSRRATWLALDTSSCARATGTESKSCRAHGWPKALRLRQESGRTDSQKPGRTTLGTEKDTRIAGGWTGSGFQQRASMREAPWPSTSSYSLSLNSCLFI